MRKKLLSFMMPCCLAFSANACGTDGTHQSVTENETTYNSDENKDDTITSDDGPFDQNRIQGFISIYKKKGEI